MKFSEKTKLSPGMWVIVCPLCGSTIASASDKEFLPDYSICDCDRNGNKLPVFEVYNAAGVQTIRRNKYPRFSAKITFDGDASDLEDVVVLDEEATPEVLAKALRKAGEFLIKKSNG
ncbi:hypothetical protein [Bacteroides reticulotermitis]|uniref:Uncharacterized protein n=1 Tax=Bacteroides reticulotermitis TaxID=1133319 RepID=A0A840D5X2_9BACE|nr:hypothetical protein [Bacteroides reticulotermitis]MBB4043793.1 hypothetical protein [Bacteroides reticulotermitis]